MLYPGSFDPIHNGHVELIETASHLFDEVVVATMRNPQKGEPLFDLVEVMGRETADRRLGRFIAFLRSAGNVDSPPEG